MLSVSFNSRLLTVKQSKNYFPNKMVVVIDRKPQDDVVVTFSSGELVQKGKEANPRF